MLLGEILEGKVLLTPTKTAIVSDKARYTYAQFNGRVNMLANSLISSGATKGTRVGMALVNSCEYMEITFACAKIGAVSTHMNSRSSIMDMHYLIEDSACRILFTNCEFASLEELKKLAHDRGITLVIVGGSSPGVISYDTFIENASPVLNEIAYRLQCTDIAVQRYTSGTTGKPKGVLQSHRSIINHTFANLIDCGWRGDDVFLQILPMFHAAGSGAINSFIAGGTLVTIPKYKAKIVCSVIEKEKVTIMGMVPNMVENFISHEEEIEAYDISSLRLLSYGAAPMPVTVLKKAMNKLRCDFVQFFGMTETGPIISVLRMKDHTKQDEKSIERLNSVGQAATGAVIKIIDEQWRECPPGVPGEIITKAPGIMERYHDLPDMTEEVMKNGWYITNDIGYLDEDGYLFLVDRKHDMIISGGENVYPSEVEKCIREMEAHVADCFVFGLPCNKWGEKVCAAIIRQEGSDVTDEEIRSFCSGKLSRYKIPKEIIFAESFMYSATGKLMRNELREKYMSLNKEYISEKV